MEKSFLGVGLINALLLAFFVILISVMLKTVTLKYPIPGITPIIQAA